MVDKGNNLPVIVQCELLEVNRSNIYYQRKVRNEQMIQAQIESIYQSYPVYGYRRIRACLQNQGVKINNKRVLRIMRNLGLRAIYPKPKTTIANRNDDKKPYLLKGLEINKPHQAWQVDITYLRTDQGFMYLTSLIDCYSRYYVGWSFGNSMDQETIMRALEHALDHFPAPDIINSDQGRQFTSGEWTKTLTRFGIKVSHSGAGRSNDNAYIERLWRTLKYEWMILKGIRTVSEYKQQIPEFIKWYNEIRPHQSLGYKTPAELVGLKKSLWVCG